MPIALRPERTWPLVLAGDMDLPEDRRPTFWFRHLTAGQWTELAEFGDDAEALKQYKGAAALRKLSDVLDPFLASWTNLRTATGEEVVYRPGCKLLDVLSADELGEVYWELRRRTGLSVPEKKDSGSPPPSETATSARGIVLETVPGSPCKPGTAPSFAVLDAKDGTISAQSAEGRASSK